MGRSSRILSFSNTGQLISSFHFSFKGEDFLYLHRLFATGSSIVWVSGSKAENGAFLGALGSESVFSFKVKEVCRQCSEG